VFSFLNQSCGLTAQQPRFSRAGSPMHQAAAGATRSWAVRGAVVLPRSSSSRSLGRCSFPWRQAAEDSLPVPTRYRRTADSG
jgi:hypothetical protein